MNSRLIFISLLIISISLFAFFEDNDDNALQVSKEKRFVNISLVSPQSSNTNITVNSRGIIQAEEQITINALSDGIFHPKVTTATFVKKSELIGVITNTTRVNNINSLKSKIILLKEDINIENKKIQSAKKMLDLGIISKNDMLSQESSLKSKQLRLLQANNELQHYKLLQKNENIYAKKSGYIESILADGGYVSYGSNIAKISSQKTVVRIFVDPKYINSIKVLQQIKLITPQGNFNAKVFSILPKSSSNLIEIIANTTQRLSVGLSIEAQIEMNSLKGWIIPKDCIVLEQNRAAIYVIKDSIAHIHFIDVKKDMIDRVFIQNHLKGDEKIAFNNAYMLHDGVRVEVSSEK